MTVFSCATIKYKTKYYVIPTCTLRGLNNSLSLGKNVKEQLYPYPLLQINTYPAGLHSVFQNQAS